MIWQVEQEQTTEYRRKKEAKEKTGGEQTQEGQGTK